MPSSRSSPSSHSHSRSGAPSGPRPQPLLGPQPQLQPAKSKSKAQRAAASIAAERCAVSPSSPVPKEPAPGLVCLSLGVDGIWRELLLVKQLSEQRWIALLCDWTHTETVVGFEDALGHPHCPHRFQPFEQCFNDLVVCRWLKTTAEGYPLRPPGEEEVGIELPEPRDEKSGDAEKDRGAGHGALSQLSLEAILAVSLQIWQSYQPPTPQAHLSQALEVWTALVLHLQGKASATAAAMLPTKHEAQQRAHALEVRLRQQQEKEKEQKQEEEEEEREKEKEQQQQEEEREKEGGNSNSNSKGEGEGEGQEKEKGKSKQGTASRAEMGEEDEEDVISETSTSKQGTAFRAEKEEDEEDVISKGDEDEARAKLDKLADRRRVLDCFERLVSHLWPLLSAPVREAFFSQAAENIHEGFAKMLAEGMAAKEDRQEVPHFGISTLLSRELSRMSAELVERTRFVAWDWKRLGHLLIRDFEWQVGLTTDRGEMSLPLSKPGCLIVAAGRTDSSPLLSPTQVQDRALKRWQKVLLQFGALPIAPPPDPTPQLGSPFLSQPALLQRLVFSFLIEGDHGHFFARAARCCRRFRQLCFETDAWPRRSGAEGGMEQPSLRWLTRAAFNTSRQAKSVLMTNADHEKAEEEARKRYRQSLSKPIGRFHQTQNEDQGPGLTWPLVTWLKLCLKTFSPMHPIVCATSNGSSIPLRLATAYRVPGISFLPALRAGHRLLLGRAVGRGADAADKTRNATRAKADPDSQDRPLECVYFPNLPRRLVGCHISVQPFYFQLRWEVEDAKAYFSKVGEALALIACLDTDKDITAENQRSRSRARAAGNSRPVRSTFQLLLAGSATGPGAGAYLVRTSPGQVVDRRDPDWSKRFDEADALGATPEDRRDTETWWKLSNFDPDSLAFGDRIGWVLCFLGGFMRSSPLVGCAVTHNDSIPEARWVPALSSNLTTPPSNGSKQQNGIQVRYERRSDIVIGQDAAVRVLPTPARPSPSVEDVLTALGGLPPPLEREAKWRRALETCSSQGGAAAAAASSSSSSSAPAALAAPPAPAAAAAAPSSSAEPLELLTSILKRKNLDPEMDDSDDEDEIPAPGRASFKRPFPFVTAWPAQKVRRTGAALHDEEEQCRTQ